MKSLSTLLLAFIALIFFHTAKADHVMGSDISWECIAKDSFKITVTTYSDCNGDTISQNNIHLINQCSGDTIALAAALSETEDITPTCDEACTRCSDNTCTDTRFGVHKIELTATVKLDRTKCCEWKITWGECCRSAGITTGPASANHYNEAWMNICNSVCNSSPYFTRPPVAIFCKDACTIYNPGVNDKDMVNGKGDSLVYKLAKPFSAAGTPVTYSTGYSYDEPISYFGDPNKNASWEPNCSGFHLDTFTGELKFKPAKAEESVFVIAVEEWRKDSTGTPKKVSEIRRDIQLIVEDCNSNTAPIITSDKNVYTFCENQSGCITMNTSDADVNDTLWLNAFVSHLPGAVFISESGKKSPKGTFCWKPTKGNVRSYPYHFVAEVLDNACPYPGRGNKTFTMYVRPAPAATMLIQKNNTCGEFSFKAISDTGVKITEYLWQGETPLGDAPIWSKDSIFTYNYSEGGTYKITLTVTSENGCKTTYVDYVSVATKVKVDLQNDSIVCRNSAIEIKSWRFFGNQPFTYKWSTGDSGVTSLKDQIVDRDTFFAVSITDANGCVTWDTLHVLVDTTRAGANAEFTADSIGIRTYKFMPADTAQGSYFWDFGDGTTSKDKSPKHTFGADSTHIVTLIARDTTYCEAIYKYTFKDPCECSSSPKISAFNDQLNYVFCAGQEKCIDFITSDADTLDKVYLSWDNSVTNASLTSDTSKRLATGSFCWTPDTSMVSSQPHKVTVYAFDNSTCQLTDSIIVNITVVDAPDAGFKADSVGIREYSFMPNFGASVGYNWDFGDGSTSTDKNPVHQYSKDSAYTVKLTVRNGYNCLFTDSMVLNVELCTGTDTASTLPKGKLVKNMTNCHSIIFEADIDSSVPVATYLWEGEVAFGDRPIWLKDTTLAYHYNKDGTYKIKLTLTSIYGCQTVIEDSVTIISPQNPFTIDSIGLRSYRFIPQDTVGTSFWWNFGDSTASTDKIPIHTFTKDSTYTVNFRWVKDGHCSAEDTVYLTVDICSGTNAPQIQVINEQPVYYLCAGETGCINVIAGDADTMDKITLSWDNSISGASFTVDSSNWATTKKINGKLCWTPSANDVQTQPYELTVTATDSLCGLTTTKTIKVMVVSPTASFTIDSVSTRTISLTPADTSYINYSWAFGDGDTSVIKKPSHTYSSDGTYSITLTVTDSLGCISTSTQAYTVITTSINDKLNGEWKVYPNPITSNKLIIEAPVQFSSEVSIVLFDANGRRILEVNKVKDRKTVINLPENMQPGTYLVKIFGERVYSTDILVR